MKLSERIEDEVGNTHSAFAKLVEAHRLFQNRESYQRLLAAQLVMLSSVRPLYHDPLIQRQFPQLTSTDNLVQIILDLAGLGLKRAHELDAVDCLPYGFVSRLGWLYISEWLTQMAPSWWELARELELTENVVGYDAQPLTENPYRWLLLKETLDNLSLSEVEEDRIFAGARSAIRLFAKLIRHASNLPRQRRMEPRQ
jgi:heme oxygenase